MSKRHKTGGRSGGLPSGGEPSRRREADGRKDGGRFAAWVRANRRDIRFLLIFAFCMLVYYGCTLLPPIKNGFFPAYLRWNATAAGTMLRVLGEEVTVEQASIIAASGASIRVERGCDAVEPSALFVSAVLASPVPWLSRMAAAAVGTLLLMLLNLVRVASLFWFRVHHPGAFETMHLDVWQALFIFLAIVLWAMWASRASRRLAVQTNGTT